MTTSARAPAAAVRVRFAPSPSGPLHVGNARTALFNWLLARSRGGTFVLRIEDTDAARSTPEAERQALADLRWLGLDWDEGIEAGGDYGPYRQSERRHIYRAHAAELLATGWAYQCFCPPAQLEADRAAALAAGQVPMYVGRCRDLSRDAARRRIDQGEAAVVRFRVPRDLEVIFEDLVRGTVRFHTDVIGDPVLLRSNGHPSYNFAVVIDDVLMSITHVVRGEDHVSNTPRQVLLYDAFGWSPPAFAHVSMVMGPDHTKLAKRHGATSVTEFRERGYLPESLANYLALIGWSPGGDDELLPIDELARRFRLEDVGHSAGVFDPEKLDWVNRHYLKHAAADRLAGLAIPFLHSAGWVTIPSAAGLRYLESVVPPVAASLDRLEQLSARLRFVFEWSRDRTLADPVVAAEVTEAREVVVALAEELQTAAPMLDRDAFRAVAQRVRDRTGRKGRALFHPLRLVLTGEAAGLELDIAVPAIEHGAALEPTDGIAAVVGAKARAMAFADALPA